MSVPDISFQRYQLRWLTTLLITVLTFGSTTIAQQERSEQKLEVDQNNAGESLAIISRIELMKSLMKGMFSEVDLSDKQQMKIELLIDTNVPNVVKTSERFRSILSDEERRQFKGHFKMGRLAKYTVERSKEYALKRLRLTPERKREYLAVEAKAKAAETKMNNEIAAVLTTAQRTQLAMFNQNQTKILGYRVVLPHMNSKQDIEEVQRELERIDTLKVIKIRPDQHLVRIEVVSGTQVIQTLQKLSDSGNLLFQDFSFELHGNDTFEELSKINPSGKYIMDAIEKQKEKNEQSDN